MSDDIIHIGGKAYRATGCDAQGRPLYERVVFNPLPKITPANAGERKVSKPMRVRQSDKPLMNKIESEYFSILNVQHLTFQRPRPQAKRYQLANGVTYTPDITASSWPDDEGVEAAVETAWEVKGVHSWDDAMVKIKVAAHEWPEIRWFLVWKDPAGRWQKQRILP